MRRTLALSLTALALFACGQPGEEADGSGSAASGSEIPAGIYDGPGAVLQVKELEGGNRLYSFAHSFEKQAPGAPVALEIIKGAIEVKRGETPKLTSDEIYPCSANVKFEGDKVVATGRCKNQSRDFKISLSPRSQDKLVGTFVKDGVKVDITEANAKEIKFKIAGAGLRTNSPERGEYVYGGGAFRGDFGPEAADAEKCSVYVVTRSVDKALVLDVGGTSKSIDLDVRGKACGTLKSGRFVRQ